MEEININKIHTRTIDVMRLWKGFSVFETLLMDYPKVEVFLAGGAMRDLIVETNNTPKDFDFFLGGEDTNIFLERLEEVGTLKKGPFGSPRWFPKDCCDQYADVILIKQFFNGLWNCEDMVDVLNQFDFTANAIAVNLRSPSLLDPQNGIRDIKRQVIRAVRLDYPDEPISTSCSLSRLSVLWHRIHYYSKKTGFHIEPVTNRWLLANIRFKNDRELFQHTFHLKI